MNYLIKISFLLIIVLLFYYCDKPSPTELVDGSTQDDSFEVEVIAKDTEDEFYSNGFDTSGIFQNQINSIININGGKITLLGQTEKYSIAQTIFYNKSNPVFNSSGRLIGYKTLTPGIIRFNNLLARLVDFKIKFRDSGQIIDTLLGKKYVLYNGRGFFQDTFEFPYNSQVSFSFNPLIGNPVNFNIPTPVEVTGTVRFEGNRVQKNLKAILEWNGANSPNFSIIIGARKRNSQDVFPIYRIKTSDDGRLIIPSKLLMDISRDRFDRLSFTFIRSFDNRENLNGHNVFISSQSIHTIYLELP